MFRRIAFVLLALIALLLVFEVYKLYDLRQDLKTSRAGYFYGPEDADLVVTEFLDYQCIYCRQVHPVITQAVRQDGNVKFIPRPVASSNPESVYQAIFAYNAGKQGKFLDAHELLLTREIVLDETTLFEISQDLDIDLEQLNEDVNAQDSGKELTKNIRLFRALNGQATPTFLIGQNMLYVPQGRMPTVNDFLNMFEQARNQNR